MRIVAGKHRGRPLLAPEGPTIRPTQDRTRESLFNLLEHGRLASDGSRVAGAIVLDAFCGNISALFGQILNFLTPILGAFISHEIR